MTDFGLDFPVVVEPVHVSGLELPLMREISALQKVVKEQMVVWMYNYGTETRAALVRATAFLAALMGAFQHPKESRMAHLASAVQSVEWSALMKCIR